MITTLGYQLKDFQEFMRENLEKRGYKLAPGAKPKLVVIKDYDDPECLLAQVLVEERGEITTQANAVKKVTAPRTVTEKEAARRATSSERFTKMNEDKMRARQEEPYVKQAQENWEKEQVEMGLEVVATSTEPFSPYSENDVGV